MNEIEWNKMNGKNKKTTKGNNKWHKIRMKQNETDWEIIMCISTIGSLEITSRDD